MNTAGRLLLGLSLAGCAGTVARMPSAPTFGHPSPAAKEVEGTIGLRLAEGVGCDDDMESAFQLAPGAAGAAGPCTRSPGKLLELGPDLCPAVAGSEELVGPCIRKEAPVPIAPASGPCGQVRQVAVAAAGRLVAFASDREGIYLRAALAEPLAPLPGFAAKHATDLRALIGPASLLFFSEDGRFLFLAPLEGPPIVVDLATRAEAPPSPAQSAEIERRVILKARIRLLAKDDRLKEVGLRWALRLGDTGSIEAVARIATSSSDATLRELASTIMRGYASSFPDVQ